MPEWIIHDKWAMRMGISRNISKYVNNLVDFPKKNEEYFDYCIKKVNMTRKAYKRLVKSGIMKDYFCAHDGGRGKKITLNFQLEFLEGKGEDYIVVYYLHHLLDYFEASPKSDEEFIESFREKTQNDKYSDIQERVISFFTRKHPSGANKLLAMAKPWVVPIR